MGLEGVGVSFPDEEEDPLRTGVVTKKLTTRCSKCHKTLEAGVEYRDSIWHRECLTCSNCPARLAGTKFTSISGKPFCFHCYGELYAHKCKACSLPIYGFGEEFLIFMEGQHWHVGCFSCLRCQTPLLGEISFNRPEGVLCKSCGTQKSSSTALLYQVL